MPQAQLNIPWCQPPSPALLSIAERRVQFARIAELELQYARLSGDTSIPQTITGTTGATSTVINAITSEQTRGRPLQLTLPCPADPDISISEFLCTRAKDGYKLATTCAIAGIQPASVKRWITRGQELANMIESGDILMRDLAHTNDIDYYKFYINYCAAEAEYISQLELEVSRAALQGKHVERRKDIVITNPETGAVIDKLNIADSITITRDGVAARELLTIHDPDTYDKPRQLKLTGTGEHGEIEISDKRSVEDFMALLSVATPDEQLTLLELLESLKRRREKTIELGDSEFGTKEHGP